MGASVDDRKPSPDMPRTMRLDLSTPVFASPTFLLGNSVAAKADNGPSLARKSVGSLRRAEIEAVAREFL